MRRCARAAVLAVLAAAAAAGPASADGAPGTLDTTFGQGGFATATPTAQLAVAGAIAVQPDGKLVTAGELRTLDNRKRMVVARMQPWGELDRSFGDGGVVTIAAGRTSSANTLTLQRDGKIVVAGTGTDGDHLAFAAVRLLPDGTPDAGFGDDGVGFARVGASAITLGVAVRPDGRILLGGTARLDNADARTNRFAIAALTPDGSVDRSCGDRGATVLGGPSVVWGMALQPDGRAVLAGQAGVSGQGRAFMAARVLPDGTPDPAFGTAGIVTPAVAGAAVANAVALQPDGRIVLTGNAFDGDGYATTVRLLPDGAMDPSFGTGGVAQVPLYQAANGLALQPNGKIVIAATTGHTIRLLPDGALDPAWGAGGIAVTQLGERTAANGVAVQPDGKLVFAGITTLRTARGLSRPITVFRLNGDPVPAAAASARRGRHPRAHRRAKRAGRPAAAAVRRRAGPRRARPPSRARTAARPPA